ncbi:hypothetical protein WR25_09264 [Diploscapter pachys]|uniref:Uncharacterized protein n=1 Tax=Diploscapter pachys TaxID=2018661 RepID=A0A2A2KVW9_9BILA|nr:hypothetical protein WR25_09264 [Diploscapter pachys]
MMLRSRSNNAMNIAANQPKEGGANVHIKRTKKPTEEDTINEPKAKRAALSDLSNAISNVLIDSTKKILPFDKSVPVPTRRVSKRLSNVKEEIKKELEGEIAVEANGQPVENPCPSYNYDKEQATDLLSFSEFAFDIFCYFRSRESEFAVGNYLKRQPQLNHDARATLVDWMVEIQETFELNHETLYLGVKLVDIYCDKVKVVIEKDNLQLIACAAMLVASKFDERSPPLIDDFIYIAGQIFSREDMMQMEMELLDVVDFDLGAPLSYSYVRRYARVTKTDMATLTLSRYILETSLMFFDLNRMSESLLASAAFMLASSMKNSESVAEWSPVLHKYTGYTRKDVEPVMWMVNHMMHVSRQQKFRKNNTVYSKYSHEVFFEVALTPFLIDKFAPSAPIQVPCLEP